MHVDTCPTHDLDLIVTRSGPERLLCPKFGCDFHYMTAKGQEQMSKTVTIPKNASKEERKAAIDEVVKKKKAEQGTIPPGSKEARKAEATAPGVVKPSKADRKVKIPKELNKGRVDNTDTVTEPAIKKGADAELDANVKPKKKEAADPNLLTVSDVARELGIDPKAARAKLRRDGSRAPDGRWPKVTKGSKEYADLVARLQGDDDDSNEDAKDEEEVEEEEEESTDDADDEEEEDE